LITYDLLRPGQNFQAVYDILTGRGARRLLLSTWVLRGEALDVAKMRDVLMGYIDGNDRVLVTRMPDSEWATYNAMTELNKL
jgi:hypothetical protein